MASYKTIGDSQGYCLEKHDILVLRIIYQFFEIRY